MRIFLTEKCKVVTFWLKIFPENVFIQTSVASYLYDDVNRENNLSFKILRTVYLYTILKICST